MKPAWMESAVCASVGLDPFYPDDYRQVRDAKETCQGCPVRVPCLEYAIEDKHGVWGGTTPDERKELRRQRRKTAA